MLQIFGLAAEIELCWHGKLRSEKKEREKKQKPATLQTITQSEVRFSHVLLVSSALQAEKWKVYLP